MTNTPHVPIILIEPKHIWNITFRLIIQGKLDGPWYTTNVHIFNFVEFKIMMCKLCSIKDFIVHWVLRLLCLFELRNFETIQYALCHCKFSYMINQKFMKLCTLQDPNMKMCTLVGYWFSRSKVTRLKKITA
jgi:hypothetical protein